MMLQQTRVEAVIPYFLAFLEKFPDAASLAAAPEEAVLAAWAGLGYYSRARNLRRAAAILATSPLATSPPRLESDLLGLPGVGPYTAAALGSISLGLPLAAVDGNVLRVVSRLANDPGEIAATATKRRFSGIAQDLLDPRRPGDFNQAMMELGATVCLPASPRCPACPVRKFCAAHAAGTQASLPVKLGKPAARNLERDLLVCQVQDHLFLVRRAATETRLADFWELPEKPETGPQAELRAEFTHQIVNDRFRLRVWVAAPRLRPDLPGNGQWFATAELARIPVATTVRKALRAIQKTPLLKRSGGVTHTVN